MDQQRLHLIEDLAGLLDGEVACDSLTAHCYATDASLYQVTPLGVAFPRHTDDVAALAKYASETNTPLIARGAGTGLAGGCLGEGLIVDFSRYMNRVLRIDEKTVTVGPGVVRDELNRQLRPLGRYFPPDPSTTATTTIGGMLGVDAAGSHSVRVGSTRDHVQSLEVVLADGSRFEAASEPLAMLQQAPAGETEAPQTKRGIVSRLSKLLTDHESLIASHQPSMVRNTCGYFLRGVLQDEFVHLPRMLVGSEGTLAMFTEATLHTAPLPAHRGVVLFLFGQLEGALRSVQRIAQQQPSACDLLDRRLLSLAREADPQFAELISPAAEAALIVEQTGFSETQVQDRLRSLVRAVKSINLRFVVAHQTTKPDGVDFMWSLPNRVVALLTKLKGPSRPLPFVEDMAVPPDALQEFLYATQRILQKHQVTASLYAHAAAGQVHLRPFLPRPAPNDGRILETLARDLYQTVTSVGGSISGEHGDGLSRTAFIRTQYGPLYRVFQQIKDLFDPHNLLNPGKIISDDPHLTIKHLRHEAKAAPETVDLQLRWSPEEIATATSACNGCGECRTQSADMRMCPFFRQDTAELASPRSKANVMQGVFSESLPVESFATDEMKRLANLCFNCKQCQMECPSNVNIPQLMIEAKAAGVAANGLSRADWILARTHSFGAIGSTLSLPFNWALTNRTARWGIEKLLGISRHRKLPQFARRSFLRSIGRRHTAKPDPDNAPSVVYFVDDYANYYDPQLAQAFIAILKKNGVSFVVPRGQTSSGMSLVSAGGVDAAREVALRNVRVLAPYVRQGATVVCTEPAAALCLRDEYPRLLDHPEIESVANHTVEAGTFLNNLHDAGRLKTNFGSLNLTAGYHLPCHLRALGEASPLQQLLKLIPQFNVRTIDAGCSGMAGAWGLSEQNFRTSLRLGWNLISRMRSEEFPLGVTECSSCKMQMEQGTPTPTIHPLKLLAFAYGSLPEVQEKLVPAKRRGVIT